MSGFRSWWRSEFSSGINAHSRALHLTYRHGHFNTQFWRCYKFAIVIWSRLKTFMVCKTKLSPVMFWSGFWSWYKLSLVPQFFKIETIPLYFIMIRPYAMYHVDFVGIRNTLRVLPLRNIALCWVWCWQLGPRTGRIGPGCWAVRPDRLLSYPLAATIYDVSSCVF